MIPFTALYDGWPLAYRPNSPAALHLLTLMAHQPPGMQAVIGLPASPFHALREGTRLRILPMPNTERAHLRWEQSSLSRLAAEVGARLVHLTSGSPALFGAARSLISPTDFLTGLFTGETLFEPLEGGAGMAARLRQAFSQGGMVRARGVLWPADLPAPHLEAPVYNLPPTIPPFFTEEASGMGVVQAVLESISLGKSFGSMIPDSYVLYHGRSRELDLRRLLDAWSWAAGPIGQAYPLLLVGMDSMAEKRLRSLLVEYQLEDTVGVLPALPIKTLAAFYQGCSALFQPNGVAPWADPIRLALACGKPVVGLESPLSEALLGPAGYLVKTDGPHSAISRALGAALITVVVDESVAETLSQAASQRAAAWKSDAFIQSLGEAYQALIVR